MDYSLLFVSCSVLLVLDGWQYKKVNKWKVNKQK